MALHLADHGVDVVVTYRNDEKEARGVVAEVEKKGRKAVALQLEVSDTASFGAFAEALGMLAAENRARFQILKELNQAPLGELASIYADVNRHLANLRIIPPGSLRTSSTSLRKRSISLRRGSMRASSVR